LTGSASPGEDDPDEEQLFRDLWEDETQREVVLESLQAFEISQSILYPTCMQSRDTYCDVYYYYFTRQRWRPDMAALRCTCEQGTNLWGEFWWIEGEHRWVFFDDEKTSQTYADQLTHCPECGRSLERKGLRATTPSLLP
jgi:hypothetical protein